MRTIIGNIIKANKIFKMINNHDKICVGVSGGKDSILLFFALNRYRLMLKERMNWDIEVIGVHAKVNFFDIDYKPLIDFCKKHDMHLEMVESNIGDILNQNKKNGMVQCSLCSRMKKAMLVEYAKKLGCNKIAMGHHADDAIETIFMNMVNEARIATFKPVINLDRSQMILIRPLILIREKEIKRVVRRTKLPVIKKMCPVEGITGRENYKNFIEKEFYKKHPQSYTNFYNALLNGEFSDLWFYDDFKPQDLRKRTNNKSTLVSDEVLANEKQK